MSKLITWIDDNVPPEVIRHCRKDRRQRGPAGLDCDKIENVVACELHKALGETPHKASPKSGGVDLAALRRIAAKSTTTDDLEKLAELKEDAKIPDDLYDLLVRALGHDRLKKLLRDVLSGRTPEAKAAARKRAGKKSRVLTCQGFKLSDPIESIDLTASKARRQKSTGPTFLGFPVSEEPK